MTTYIKETVANIEKLFGIELTDEQEEQLTYINAAPPDPSRGSLPFHSWHKT